MKERKTGRNGAGGVANRTVKVHGRGMRIWKADRGERARRAFEEGLVLCARDGHASRVYVYTRQTDIYKSAFLSPIFRSLPFVQSKDRFESMDFEKGYGWRLSLYYKYFRLARRKVVAWIYNISIEYIFATIHLVLTLVYVPLFFSSLEFLFLFHTSFISRVVYHESPISAG